MSWLGNIWKSIIFDETERRDDQNQKEVDAYVKCVRDRFDAEIHELRVEMDMLLQEVRTTQCEHIHIRPDIIQLSEDIQQDTTDMNSRKTLPRTEPIKTLRIEDDKVKVEI